MALPVTITGLSTTVACAGPFKSSAGNFYFFGVDSASNIALDAYKATDPTSSFSQVATINQPASSQILTISGFQVGDVVYLSTGDKAGSVTGGSVHYSFDLATDTFGGTSTNANGTNLGSGDRANSSVLRRSDGDNLNFFNGATEGVMGTQYSNVRIARFPSLTATASVLVSQGGSTHWSNPEAVFGASDRIHLFWTDQASNTYHRSLSSGNVLGTTTGPYSIGARPAQAVSYSDGTDTRVVCIGDAGVLRFIDADNPTISVTAIAGMTAPARLFVDGTDVYAVYRKAADSDLYIRKSTDHGATWGSETSFFVATVGDAFTNLSIDGRVYDRSGSVFPYVVNDNGTLKYNEHSLGAAVITGVATQTIPAITQSATGTTLASFAGAQTVPVITQAATGLNVRSVAADQTVPVIAQAATGETMQTAILAAAQSLTFSQDATGTVPSSGVAAQTLPVITQSATASAPASLVSTQNVPVIAQSATGTLRVAFAASQPLPAITQAATATTPVGLTASQTVPVIEQSANATTLVELAAAQTLPAIEQNATGTTLVSFAAVQNVPAFTQAATVTLRVAFNSVQTLPVIEQAATGDAPASFDAAQTIPAIEQTATLEKIVTAVADQTIDPLVQDATATTPASLDAAQSFAIGSAGQLESEAFPARNFDAAQPIVINQVATGDARIDASADHQIELTQTAVGDVRVAFDADQTFNINSSATLETDAVPARVFVADQTFAVGSAATGELVTGASADQSFSIASEATGTARIAFDASQTFLIEQSASGIVWINVDAAQSFAIGSAGQFETEAFPARHLAADQTLPAFVQATSGSPVARFVAAQIIPTITQTATVIALRSAIANQTFAIGQSATGKVVINGSLDQSFNLTQTATAIVREAAVEYEADQTLEVIAQVSSARAVATTTSTQSLAFTQSAVGNIDVAAAAQSEIIIPQSALASIILEAVADQQFTVVQEATGRTQTGTLPWPKAIIEGSARQQTLVGSQRNPTILGTHRREKI